VKLSFWISLLLVLVALNGYSQDRAKSHNALVKGMSLFRQAKYQSAIKSFEQSILFDSTNYDAWLKRGFVRGILGDFEGEKNDYNFVISHAPDHSHAYVSRGAAFSRLNDVTSAMADFNTAIQLDPANQEAFNNRGFAKKALGDKEGACADWEESRRLGNKEAVIILKNNYCQHEK
jgi:Flp pilus assembly protein TadD